MIAYILAGGIVFLLVDRFKIVKAKNAEIESLRRELRWHEGVPLTEVDEPPLVIRTPVQIRQYR